MSASSIFTARAVALVTLAALAIGCPKSEDSSGKDKSAADGKGGKGDGKGDKGGKGDKSTDKKPDDKGSKDDKPAKDTSKLGLNNPTNDAKLAAAVKQVVADCGKTMDETSNSDDPARPKHKGIYECGAKWDDFSKLTFDKGAPTLVNLLEDPDVKVRSVALNKLDSWGGWDWKTDPDLCKRILAGIKNEDAKSPIDAEWAQKLAEIDATKSGITDDLKKYLTDKDTPIDVKLNYVAWADGNGDVGYDVTKTYASANDPALVNAAVQGYLNHFDDHKDEACGYWSAHLDTPDKTANRYALGHLTGGWNGNTSGDTDSDDYSSGGGGGPSDTNTCGKDDLQKAIDSMTKAFEANNTDNDFTSYSLKELAQKGEMADPAIKKEAVDLLKKMIEKKDYSRRSTMLDALVRADPGAYKAYAQKFATDDDLKSTVESLNKDKDLK